MKILIAYDGSEGADKVPLQIPPGLKRARAHAAQIVKHAQGLAESGIKRVRKIFPYWTVTHKVRPGRLLMRF